MYSEIDARGQAETRGDPPIAADPLEDEHAIEAQVKRLMAAWNAAGPDARADFLARIGARA